MGKRGPAPKPHYLKMLHGTLNVSRDNPSPPPVPIDDSLQPPDWFDADRVNIWTSVCSELAAMKGLTRCDYQMLVMYVDSIAECHRLMKKMMALQDSVMVPKTVDKNGKEYKKTPKQVPYYPQLLQQKQMALRFAVHFGMTPSARARIVFLPKDGEGEGENDPFAERGTKMA